MEKEIATYGLKDRLLYYEALLAKKQMFNGHILKLVAAITMFIDHFSVAILMYGREGLYTRFGGGLERAVFFERLNVVTQTGRLIGRTAFPIYCFLLVEGFFHTSSRGKYFLRLLLFCFLSEYAFDHALYPQASTSAHCSVFVTLTLGFCMMWIMETLKESWGERLKDPYDRYRVTLLFLDAVIFVVFTRIAFAAASDYRGWGIAAIGAFYLLHDYRGISSIAAYAVLVLSNLSEAWAFPGIFLIQCYNGKRGKQWRIAHYLFYPGHLLFLLLLRRFLLGE